MDVTFKTPALFDVLFTGCSFYEKSCSIATYQLEFETNS